MKNPTPLNMTVLLLVLLALPGRAGGEQLLVRNYRASDGLAQDRVKGIVRDSRGFLWFCTADGLSRFDGSRFTTYDASNGLPFSSINDLPETRGGAYWVATNGGGVFHFNPDAAPRSAEEVRELFTNFLVSNPRRRTVSTNSTRITRGASGRARTTDFT